MIHIDVHYSILHSSPCYARCYACRKVNLRMAVVVYITSSQRMVRMNERGFSYFRSLVERFMHLWRVYLCMLYVLRSRLAPHAGTRSHTCGGRPSDSWRIQCTRSCSWKLTILPSVVVTVSPVSYAQAARRCMTAASGLSLLPACCVFSYIR